MWTLTNQPPSEGVRFQAVFHRTVNGRKETATRHLRRVNGIWWGVSLDTPTPARLWVRNQKEQRVQTDNPFVTFFEKAEAKAA